MHTLVLPPELAHQVEHAAETMDVEARDLALVLLNVAFALRQTTARTGFVHSVHAFLHDRSVEQRELGAVIRELVERCLSAPSEGDELSGWRGVNNPVQYRIPTGAGVAMVKEQPMYAYEAPAPAPLARASAMGRYAHLSAGSEAFARAKAAEIAREDRERR